MPRDQWCACHGHQHRAHIRRDREAIPGSLGSPTSPKRQRQVGQTQAAIDLDIVVEYGVGIAELGKSINAMSSRPSSG
jgi:hypothetical protein